MKTEKAAICAQAFRLLLAFTVVCGGLYTLLLTGILQVVFPQQANGSLFLSREGKAYGSACIGQPASGAGHLWGRVMGPATDIYRTIDGEKLFYSGPSNLSPASPAYKKLLAQRVAEIRAAHPEMGDTPVPVDLVTNSGSGLDPQISPAAASYQVRRLSRNTGRSEEEVQSILDRCTEGRFLGIFGEPRVNVLKVNLILDGIL